MTKTHGQKISEGKREHREDEDRYPRNPEAKAHRARLESMVPPHLLRHPRIKDVLQRQTLVILADLSRRGFHSRQPKADHDLMRAIEMAKREPFTPEPDDA